MRFKKEKLTFESKTAGGELKPRQPGTHQEEIQEEK